MLQNVIHPRSSVGPLLNVVIPQYSEYYKLKINIVSFTLASISVMESKNQTKTKVGDHGFPHQNVWIKAKVESDHKLSSETKSTSWSQLGMGSGNWRPFVPLLRSRHLHPCTPTHLFSIQFLSIFIRCIESTREHLKRFSLDQVQ